MNRNLIMLPGAIILAGLIIAIAVYVVRENTTPMPAEEDVSALRPVNPSEHIVGNPTAPVIVVEYSDLDCAYCKQFQRTMSQIMIDYGAEGQVAWVYRHLPLVHLHPNSGQHAEASECVASLAGEDAFWRFIDLLHADVPSTSEFDPNDYETVLRPLGINTTAFDQCLGNGQFVKRVEADLTNALAIGATAAPYSVILIQGADPIVLSGTLPYASMKQVIDDALSKVK